MLPLARPASLICTFSLRPVDLPPWNQSLKNFLTESRIDNATIKPPKRLSANLVHPIRSPNKRRDHLLEFKIRTLFEKFHEINQITILIPDRPKKETRISEIPV